MRLLVQIAALHTGPGQDRATDLAVLPQVDPASEIASEVGLSKMFGLSGLLKPDIGDAVALFVIDRQINLLRQF